VRPAHPKHLENSFRAKSRAKVLAWFSRSSSTVQIFFRRKTVQFSETLGGSVALALTLKNKVCNVVKICAKSRKAITNQRAKLNESSRFAPIS
jgi:SPX domain protein involved in polyphosphate accumulation